MSNKIKTPSKKSTLKQTEDQISNGLPFDNLFYPMLTAFHKAVYHCYKITENGEKLDLLCENDQYLLDLFRNLFSTVKMKPGINKHITKGIFKSNQSKSKEYPRLSRLTIQLFKDSVNSSKHSKNSVLLPSPLALLFQSLTLPEEIHSSAYSLLLCRSMLFSFLSISPEYYYGSSDQKNNAEKVVFNDLDILDSISSLRQNIMIQNRWPTLSRVNPYTNKSSSKTLKVHLLIGHFLSMLGYLHLWFNISDKRDQIKAFYDLDKELDDKACANKYSLYKVKYLFKISSSFDSIPDGNEIINLLTGLPLPIKGAESVFYGGLRLDPNNGLVVNLSGKPGVGKTSVAIALSVALSPMRTNCIYLSLEEEPEQLFKRMITLVPSYLRSLSIYRRQEDLRPSSSKWFYPFKINEEIDLDNLTHLILEMNNLVIDRKKSPDDQSDKKYIPAVCPLMIVVDNINELVSKLTVGSSEAVEFVHNFVQTCRKLQALVVIVTAEDISKKIELDYLTDISIHLCQTGNETLAEKPQRVLQIIKTRHQLSRQGTHVFHMFGPSGFRISPQIPSFIDMKHKRNYVPLDKSELIYCFEQHGSSLSKESLLDIYPNSEILLYGYGSTGKAGLALNLLLTPPVNKDLKPSSINETQITFSSNEYRRKILIVSFLYPTSYYNTLINKVQGNIKRYFRNLQTPIWNPIILYSGYLSPEDFVWKVTNAVEEAILNGEPYTGVLLDGLHNVFLQFPKLQDVPMIWALLQESLRRYNVTVVRTFTNFSLAEWNIDLHAGSHQNILNQSLEDQALLQKGQNPLLQTIVRSTDYFFILEEHKKYSDDYHNDYLLKVKSAKDQRVPSKLVIWDKQNLKISKITVPEKIFPPSGEAHKQGD